MGQAGAGATLTNVGVRVLLATMECVQWHKKNEGLVEER